MGTEALRQQGRAAPCRTGANRKPAASPALAPLRTDTFIVTTSFGSHIREKPGCGGGLGPAVFHRGKAALGLCSSSEGKAQPRALPRRHPSGEAVAQAATVTWAMLKLSPYLGTGQSRWMQDRLWSPLCTIFAPSVHSWSQLCCFPSTPKTPCTSTRCAWPASALPCTDGPQKKVVSNGATSCRRARAP